MNNGRVLRANWNLYRRHVVLYCILAPYDNEQSDLIHRIKEDKNLEELPVYQQLVKLFTTPELINWTEMGEILFLSALALSPVVCLVICHRLSVLSPVIGSVICYLLYLSPVIL